MSCGVVDREELVGFFRRNRKDNDAGLPLGLFSPFQPARGNAYVHRWCTRDDKREKWEEVLRRPAHSFVLVGPRNSGRTSTAYAIAAETPWRQMVLHKDWEPGETTESLCSYILNQLGSVATRETSSMVGGEFKGKAVALESALKGEYSTSDTRYSAGATISAAADAILQQRAVVIVDDVPLLSAATKAPVDGLLQLIRAINNDGRSGRYGRIILVSESTISQVRAAQLGLQLPNGCDIVPVVVPHVSTIKSFLDHAYETGQVNFKARIGTEIRRASSGSPDLYHFLAHHGLQNARTPAQGSEFVVGHFEVWNVIQEHLSNTGVYRAFDKHATRVLSHFVRGDRAMLPHRRYRAAFLDALCEDDGKSTVSRLTRLIHKRHCVGCTTKLVEDMANSLAPVLRMGETGCRGKRSLVLRDLEVERLNSVSRLRRAMERWGLSQIESPGLLLSEQDEALRSAVARAKELEEAIVIRKLPDWCRPRQSSSPQLVFEFHEPQVQAN